MSDPRLIERITSLGRQLAQLVASYDMLQDLSAIPGAAPLRVAANSATQLARALEERADEIDGLREPAVIVDQPATGSNVAAFDLIESRGVARDAGPALPHAPRG